MGPMSGRHLTVRILPVLNLYHILMINQYFIDRQSRIVYTFSMIDVGIGTSRQKNTLLAAEEALRSHLLASEQRVANARPLRFGATGRG